MPIYHDDGRPDGRLCVWAVLISTSFLLFSFCLLREVKSRKVFFFRGKSLLTVVRSLTSLPGKFLVDQPAQKYVYQSVMIYDVPSLYSLDIFPPLKKNISLFVFKEETHARTLLHTPVVNEMIMPTLNEASPCGGILSPRLFRHFFFPRQLKNFLEKSVGEQVLPPPCPRPSHSLFSPHFGIFFFSTKVLCLIENLTSWTSLTHLGFFVLFLLK